MYSTVGSFGSMRNVMKLVSRYNCSPNIEWAVTQGIRNKVSISILRSYKLYTNVHAWLIITYNSSSSKFFSYSNRETLCFFSCSISLALPS